MCMCYSKINCITYSTSYLMAHRNGQHNMATSHENRQVKTIAIVSKSCNTDFLYRFFNTIGKGLNYETPLCKLEHYGLSSQHFPKSVKFVSNSLNIVWKFSKFVESYFRCMTPLKFALLNSRQQIFFLKA